MTNEIAIAAIQTLQDHDVEGIEEAKIFAPAGGCLCDGRDRRTLSTNSSFKQLAAFEWLGGVGIRIDGVCGCFVWSGSNGWGICDAGSRGLVQHVGGKIKSVQVCKDLDVSAEIVAETDRMVKVYQLARTMYHNGSAAPSKDKGDPEELIEAYGDIYMTENEIYR